MSRELTGGEFGKLVADLRGMKGPISRNLGKRMKKAADSTVRTARAKASWSSRIPQRIGARLVQNKRHPGARIVVKVAGAPHARPYEVGDGRGISNSFRHPVFGHRDRPWVTQQTRPYLFPAVREHRDEYIAAVEAAVVDTFHSIGFKGS